MDAPRRSVPIRGRLVLLAVAGILPLALVAGIGLIALFDQQRQQAQRSALEITRALAIAVDAELRQTISVLQVLSTSAQFEAAGVAQLRERLVRAATSQRNWRGVTLADPAGRILADTELPEGATFPRISETGSFDRLVAARKPQVGLLTRGALGNWLIPVRVPVEREGRLRYVLTAGVTPESILDVVARQRLEAGWVVTAVDTGGARVIRWPRQAEYIGTPVSGTLQAMMASGAPEGTGLTTTSEGNEVYTAYSRSPESGWAIALGTPRELVDAAARRTLAALGGGIALSVLLAALATLVVARSITRPMAQLRESAQAVGVGQSPTPVATHIREIGEVSRALVASAAQRARAELEREELLLREQAARAVAEAANRAKDEFLAMLGHELRNPLGAVSNAANVLQQASGSEAMRREASAIILRQVNHLTRLTDDLLDAGRALMGKIVLRREAVNLSAAAAQSLATLKSAGKIDQHQFFEDLHEAWANVDPVRMDQIISNLIVNAAKYTPPGGLIRVIVDRQGHDAVIRVADNGIGMSPELAARAFDLFVQGERELDRAQGGLGIGLTLVRRLAELHGGSASVRSDGPGKGSEFSVRLPAIEPPRQVEDRRDTPTAAARDILIVEDNEDARETLRILLEMAGHRVDVARDGQEGLERALASSPEVVLVDIGLPKLDGYEVARRMRAADGGERRPYLIALTGYGLPEDRRRALDAGFDAHLVKPVDDRTLAQVLAGLPRGAMP